MQRRRAARDHGIRVHAPGDSNVAISGRPDPPPYGGLCRRYRSRLSHRPRGREGISPVRYYPMRWPRKAARIETVMVDGIDLPLSPPAVSPAASLRPGSGRKHVQGRQAILVRDVWVGALLQQDPHDLQLLLDYGPRQRRHALVVLGVEGLGIASQGLRHVPHVAKHRGFAKRVWRVVPGPAASSSRKNLIRVSNSPICSLGTTWGGPLVETNMVLRISPAGEVNHTVPARVFLSMSARTISFVVRALTAKKQKSASRLWGEERFGSLALFPRPTPRPWRWRWKWAGSCPPRA